MYFIKAILDIVIILLLLRLLIRPNESYYNQILSLLYRITDPLLIPSRSFTRNDTKGIFLSILCLVVLRGLAYISIKPMSFISGEGYSFLNLFQLLLQFYMVIWFVSVLSQYGSGTFFTNIVQRAFLPLSMISSRLGIPRRHFSIFTFLFLLVVYALLSYLIHYVMITRAVSASFSIVHGFGEGLILIIGLFPGFFSLVIIVGALLSWVSPDPYNPVVQAIYGISEPLLAPFRRFVPNLGGLDISPIIALLCFQMLGRLGQQLVASLIGIF
ncbi:YggT family protein [Thermodesulfobacteriota bacterium]